MADGAAAVEELSKTQVDLVLLDVMMPRLNGFEACRRIKNNPITYLISVVLVKALSDKQDLRCKELKFPLALANDSGRMNGQTGSSAQSWLGAEQTQRQALTWSVQFQTATSNTY